MTYLKCGEKDIMVILKRMSSPYQGHYPRADQTLVRETVTDRTAAFKLSSEPVSKPIRRADPDDDRYAAFTDPLSQKELRPKQKTEKLSDSVLMPHQQDRVVKGSCQNVRQIAFRYRTGCLTTSSLHIQKQAPFGVIFSNNKRKLPQVCRNVCPYIL